MKIRDQSPILDGILESWQESLGSDFSTYKNHCYRVLNFCLAYSSETPEILSKVSIAVAFHDLGIWANKTYDYLAPSKQLAHDYLVSDNQSSWADEIETMIEQHHKIRKYKSNPSWLVENFRKADWIDVSRGRLKLGLPSHYVSEVLLKFPNLGFHRRLASLTKKRLKTHPFNPLPMMRL